MAKAVVYTKKKLTGAVLAQVLWAKKGDKGWEFVRDEDDYDWGPWGGIETDLSKLPDVRKKGKFTLTRESCPPKVKKFKTIEKAIRWAYDEVVDRDSDDYRYILKGTGIKRKGIDIADFAWE